MNTQTIKRGLALLALILAVASFAGMGATLLAVAIILIAVAIVL
jgi:hypothetical protein